MGYDFTNIFRIWISSLEKVIRTRNARFNDNNLHNPRNIDLEAL